MTELAPLPETAITVDTVSVPVILSGVQPVDVIPPNPLKRMRANPITASQHVALRGDTPLVPVLGREPVSRWVCVTATLLAGAASGAGVAGLFSLVQKGFMQ